MSHSPKRRILEIDPAASAVEQREAEEELRRTIEEEDGAALLSSRYYPTEGRGVALVSYRASHIVADFNAVGELENVEHRMHRCFAVGEYRRRVSEIMEPDDP